MATTGCLSVCFAGCDPLDILAGSARVSAATSSGAAGIFASCRKVDDAAERGGAGERWPHLARVGRSARHARREILNGRRIDLPDDLCGRVLRFHPSCPWGNGEVPALIAAFHPITEPDDDAMPVAIMRIGLNADGTKIAKGMMLGAGHWLRHQARRRRERQPRARNSRGTGDGAQGPRHGLASRLGARQRRSHREISAARWCRGVDDLRGQRRERQRHRGRAICAKRWADAGSEVFIRLPRKTGADWADVLKQDSPEEHFDKGGGTTEHFPPRGKPNGPGRNGNKPLILSSAKFVEGFVPPDYVIFGLLQRRFLYSLTGKTGAGKTAILLLIAAHVAEARKIIDRDVEQGRVLYLAGENADDVRMRWIALAQQMGFDLDTIDVHFIPGVFKISEMRDRIRAEIKQIGPVSLIIVDTAAAYFEGDDENYNTQFGDHARRTLRPLTTMPGEPCVIVACHPVKNASDDNLIPRGGGAFLNEMDGNLTAAKTCQALSRCTGKANIVDPTLRRSTSRCAP